MSDETVVVTAEQACQELEQELAFELEGFLDGASWLPVEFLNTDRGNIYALVKDRFDITRTVTITVAVENWLPDCDSQEWT